MNFSLLIFLLAFVILIIYPISVFADEKISSQSFSFENVSIIEFTNKSVEEIKMIKIWLTTHTFESFKSELGWNHLLTPQDVLEFTSDESLKTNETAKFGIVTEKPTSLIYWRVFDENGNQIDVGNTKSQPMPTFVSRPEPIPEKNLDVIFDKSTFKIIPEKLRFGSTLRAVGENFAPNSNLDLFIDDLRVKSIKTTTNGTFIQTLKVPQQTNSDKISFILKVSQQNKKTITRTLASVQEVIPDNIVLSVREISEKFFKNDMIDFSGKANADAQINMDIKNSKGNLFSTQTTRADPKGNWQISFSLPPDTPLGNYAATISDGTTSLTKNLAVVMAKNISIQPTKIQFLSGETMKFNGTAIPGKNIAVALLDPNGNDVFSKTFTIETGFFEIEYHTDDDSLKGTYVLYVFQELETEIVFAGLGEYPKKPLSIRLDDVNYSHDQTIVIGTTGKNLQDVKLTILDHNGNEQFNDDIDIGSDGKRNYYLDSAKLSSGVYSILLSLGSIQVSDVFTVGLHTSSLSINFDMNQKSFNPGDFIPVSGKSQPNTRLNFFLIAPNGDVIDTQESFVLKNGDFSMNSFTIPSNASPGTWIIRSESGTKSANYAFQVGHIVNEGAYVNVGDVVSTSIGKLVTIEGNVNSDQRIKILIENSVGDVVFETNVTSTNDGDFELLWRIPSDIESGIYIVKILDESENLLENTFEL